MWIWIQPGKYFEYKKNTLDIRHLATPNLVQAPLGWIKADILHVASNCGQWSELRLAHVLMVAKNMKISLIKPKN